MITVKLPKEVGLDGRVRYAAWGVPYTPGYSLLDYVPAALIGVRLSRIIWSGRSVPEDRGLCFEPCDERVFSAHTPRDGDELILIPSFSDPFIITGGIFWYSVFISWAAIAKASLLIAVTIASTLLSRALAPASPRSKQGSTYTAPTSYGWNGIQNTYGPGNPIPVIFGEHKSGVQVAYWVIREKYVKKEDTDLDLSDTKAFAMMIGIFGRGPVNAISDIRINENPIANFKNIQYWLKTGAAGQTAVPGFDEQGTSYELSQKVTTTPYIYTTTGTNLTALELLFNAPSGIGRFNDDGDVVNHYMEYRVRYKLHSSGTWTSLGTHKVWGKTTAACRWVKRIDEVAAGQYDVEVTYLGGGGSSGTRYFGEMYLGQVSEFFEDSPCAYPGLAYIAIKALATNQLSTQPFTVTGFVQGLIMPVWDGVNWTTEAWSKNAAAACRAVMSNTGWGFGNWVGSSQIDDDNWGAFFDYCAEANLLTYSEELDQENWTKSSMTVTANSVAAPSGETTAETLAATAANATLTQVYTGASAQRAFSVYLKRKTGTGNIQVTQDGASWTPVSIVSTSWTRVTLLATVLNPTVGIRIVTNGDEIYAWGAMLNTGDVARGYLWSGATGGLPRHTTNLVWNQRKNMPSLLSDILFSSRGKPFKIGGKWRVSIRREKDATQIFNSGNVIKAKTDYVDETLEYNAYDASYLSADQNYTPTSFGVDIGLSPLKPKPFSFFGVTNARETYRDSVFCLKMARDVHELLNLWVSVDAIACWPGDCIYYTDEIPGIGIADGRVFEDSAALNTVKLDQDVTIESGKSYQIVIRFSGGSNPDFIETRSVSNSPGTTDTITVSSNFTQLPKQYDLYSFGETDLVTKKYFIDDFERDSDEVIVMKCSEENTGIYEDWGTPPVDESSTFPYTDTEPPQIKHMNVLEETKVGQDGLWTTNLYLFWPVPVFDSAKGIFRGANLYYDTPTVEQDIATFESDETWTGGSACTTWPLYREKEGTRSRKITPADDDWTYSERTVSFDLSATEKQYFPIWCYVPALYDCHSDECVRLVLQTDASNYFRVQFSRANLHNGWNLILKAKSDFEATKVGSPSWGTVTKAKVGFKRRAGATDAYVIFDTWRCIRTPSWIFLAEAPGNDYYWANVQQNTFMIFKAEAISGLGVANTQEPAYAGIFTKGKLDLPVDINFIPGRCKFDTGLPYLEWGSKADGALANDGGSYTDETGAANNTTENDMTLMPASPEVGDSFIVLFRNKFRAMLLNIGTAGAGTYTIAYRYYKNATDGWTSLSGVTDESNGFKNSGLRKVSWTKPTTWEKTIVNGIEGYAVEARISAFTSMTTQPKGTQVWIYTVDKDFGLYEIRFDTDWGEKSENLIVRLPSGHSYSWDGFSKWANERGLTEAQKRDITIYIKAQDTFLNYSLNAGSINLLNAAPDMSAVTPIVKEILHGKKKDLKVRWGTYSAPPDIKKYEIYASNEATCTINETNKQGEVGPDTIVFTILGWSKKEDPDVRVRPVDLFGAGTPTN